ncbi:hypothetical protein WJX84_007942 [Apatococcus fuscideae]|uniref:Serine aminopeptidase S33 domain-containing protein n=1 Tax=Apatococcus fuscideae TaxID=2026836 RepID=A0AAW1SXV8_9CHLO
MVKTLEDRWVNARGQSLYFEVYQTYWKPKAVLVSITDMNFQDLVEDCQAFAALARWKHPPSLPAFIGGQSMGGLVALHVALADQSHWRGILLCSAAVDIEWTSLLRVQAQLGGLLSRLIPRSRIVPAVRPEDMSTDADTVRGYVEDPLNTVGVWTLSTPSGNPLRR